MMNYYWERSETITKSMATKSSYVSTYVRSGPGGPRKRAMKKNMVSSQRGNVTDSLRVKGHVGKIMYNYIEPPCRTRVASEARSLVKSRATLSIHELCTS